MKRDSWESKLWTLRAKLHAMSFLIKIQDATAEPPAEEVNVGISEILKDLSKEIDEILCGIY